MYEVQIAGSGLRDLDRVHGADLSRIQPRILSLESDARPPGAKKLKGILYRIRVGDWRIIYAIEDRHKRITILQVIRRSERTYKRI